MENKIKIELTEKEAKFVYGQIAKDLECFEDINNSDEDNETLTIAKKVLKKLEELGITW